MADFSFFHDPLSDKWVISAPRRATRPNEEEKVETISLCPFCPGRERDETELFRIPANSHGIRGLVGSRTDSNWLVRVIPNKYPFTPIHELIICSPDHHKSFEELPFSQLLDVFLTYRARYNVHRGKGSVYIFHNNGAKAGESVLHPHTQLTVVPHDTKDEIARLTDDVVEEWFDTGDFSLVCPKTSQWPDEVWIVPQRRHSAFGDVSDEELGVLAHVFKTTLKLLSLRHGDEFPFNFYIYPRMDWYLRIIPRLKTLGGFEVGTGIMVNTQDPKETMAFLKEHFHEVNEEKIKAVQRAAYHKGV